MIYWVDDKGLRVFNIRKVFTIIWSYLDPEDAIRNDKQKKARWYPGEKYNKGHSGINACVVKGYAGKFVFIV